MCYFENVRGESSSAQVNNLEVLLSFVPSRLERLASQALCGPAVGVRSQSVHSVLSQLTQGNLVPLDKTHT